MKVFQVVTSIVTNAVFAVLGLMALYTITSNMTLFSGYRSLLVQSGSMEPTIMTGDIVVIRQAADYVVRDVVTFQDDDGRIVTHRVKNKIDKGSTPSFTTKGDANSSEDPDPINLGQIHGKVVFVIPKLGYMVAFAKSLPGLIILILIPAALFVIDELLKMKNG